jgi:dynein heavy chain
LRVLDTGKLEWTELDGAPSKSVGGASGASTALAEKPKARADSQLIYDPAGKRVLIFGGWSNRWLGDAWAFPVGSVIGPPYAVLKVNPSIGPITGGQEIEIGGEGFEAGSGATVRFIAGRKVVEAPGACR